jgi:uncharacterized protein YjiS (DUF1127 family)
MFLTHLVARVQTYLRYRASVRELSRLTDRELSDIGLNRGGIHEAAWLAAAQ